METFPLLEAAATAGDSLAAIVKGFVVRAFSVPKGLVRPVSDDLRATYRLAADLSKETQNQSEGQLPLQTES